MGNSEPPDLTAIRESGGGALVIHYACESFDSATEAPPRIWLIVVKNMVTGEIRQFGDPDEKKLLKAFTALAGTVPNAWWIHWNMRDSTFGFDAIDERCQRQDLKPVGIQYSQRFDLSAHLVQTHGSAYIDRKGYGRLNNLATLNNIATPGWLHGTDQPALAEDGKLQQVKRSIARKVEMIEAVFDLEKAGVLLIASEGQAEEPRELGQGCSMGQIANGVGLSSQTLRDCAKAAGITIAGRGRGDFRHPPDDIYQILYERMSMGVSPEERKRLKGFADSINLRDLDLPRKAKSKNNPNQIQ
jgi:hypothetical protein